MGTSVERENGAVTRWPESSGGVTTRYAANTAPPRSAPLVQARLALAVSPGDSTISWRPGSVSNQVGPQNVCEGTVWWFWSCRPSPGYPYSMQDRCPVLVNGWRGVTRGRQVRTT